MTITVTGATGFIGNRLVHDLLRAGHSIHALGRERSAGLPQAVGFSEWQSTEGEPPPESLATADAIVHLAGEPVAQRWTPEVKGRIRSSRVDGTRNLVNALSKQSHQPRVLVAPPPLATMGRAAMRFSRKRRLRAVTFSRRSSSTGSRPPGRPKRSGFAWFRCDLAWFSAKTAVRSLRCCHLFGSASADAWLRANSGCPGSMSTT